MQTQTEIEESKKVSELVKKMQNQVGTSLKKPILPPLQKQAGVKDESSRPKQAA